jgi:hypothetical protein
LQWFDCNDCNAFFVKKENIFGAKYHVLEARKKRRFSV